MNAGPSAAHALKDATTAADQAVANMLVVDRELAASEPDQFRHSDLVEQVASLSIGVDPPANIALYGPWGSGKSSLGSHLEAELERRGAVVRFVRYDAFKFARLPLQRHFIRHLATELGISSRDFHDNLYEDVESSDLTLEDLGGRSKAMLLLRLVGLVLLVLAIALVIAMALTALAAVIGAWASSAQGFGDVFTSYLRGHLVGYLAPAGLLALFGALVGRKLSFTRGRTAPTSEDQFARLFEQLVESALKGPLLGTGPDRLIVFIDELDRCDPRTVVATLDSLRTFLDAKKCVFIVAADQQVLETALTAHVQQATPADLTNPYYSAGSEYLDKTFHYQLSIPPLPSRRLSNYAASLVRDKPGPWADVPSVDRVVSLLIPNHVRSPRRAKTLLNSFALLYELAERRCEAGMLAGPPKGRADEMAVLACLRVEFPLFARELDRNPKLIDAYRAVASGRDPGEFDDELWDLAQDFHSGRRPSDVVIAPEQPTAAPMTTQAGEAVKIDDSEPPNDDEAGQGTEDTISPSTDSVTAIRKAQSRLLTLYLLKTRTVSGPGRDLIHLEGPGAFLGLDPAVVERLEDAASQADQSTVNRIAERLGANGRTPALRALATTLDREPPVGVEADNVVTSLLQLYANATDAERADPEFGHISAIVASAIDRFPEYELAAEDLAGALRLGLDSSIAGTPLVGRVLEHPAADADAAVMVRAVESFERFDPSVVPIAQAAIATALQREETWEEVEAAIAALPDAESLDLVDGLAEELANSVRLAVELLSEDEELEDAGRTAAAEEAAEAVLMLLADGHVPHRQRIAAALLAQAGASMQFVGIRNAVFLKLPTLVDSPGYAISWSPLVVAVLETVHRRATPGIAPALRALEPLAASAEARHAAAERIVKTTWERVGTPYDEPAGFVDMLDSVVTLAEKPLAADGPAAAAIASAIAVPTTAADASTMAPQLRLLAKVLGSCVIEPHEVIAALAVKAVTVIEGSYVAPEPADGLVDWVTEVCGLVGRHGTTHDAAAVMDAVASATWPTARQDAALRLMTYIPARERGTDVLSPFTADELLALGFAEDEALSRLVARWLPTASPAPTDGARVISDLTRQTLAPEELDRIRAYTSQLPDDPARAEVIRIELRNVLRAMPRRGVLEALGLDTIDDEIAAELLVEVFADVGNMSQRRWVLDAWDAARITDSKARALLVRKIMVPTGESGSGGIAEVIRYIELCRDPPHGTKGLIQALRSGLGKEERERLEAAFVKVGLGARKGRLLRGDEYRDM